MKLAIIGSRYFNDYELMKSKFLEIKEQYDITCIVSGGATGADTLAEKIAHEFNLEKIIFYPEKKKYGNHANYIRNTLIAKECDLAIAFPIGKSPGTWDTIKKTKNLNKKVYISSLSE